MALNRKKNIEKFVPSIEINNNLGSMDKIKAPTSATSILTNFLKRKKLGIIVKHEKIILETLCIPIQYNGSDLSEKKKINDKKFDQPEFVGSYPIGNA